MSAAQFLHVPVYSYEVELSHDGLRAGDNRGGMIEELEHMHRVVVTWLLVAHETGDRQLAVAAQAQQVAEHKSFVVGYGAEAAAQFQEIRVKPMVSERRYTWAKLSPPMACDGSRV